MGNHPNFKMWQDMIALMRAENATEASPPEAKKWVEGKIKLLEAAVKKFDDSYPKFETIWQELPELKTVAEADLAALKARFAEVNEYSKHYKKAMECFEIQAEADHQALRKLLRLGDSPPTRNSDDFSNLPAATAKRDQIVGDLADVESRLNGAVSVCDRIGKWRDEVNQCRIEASNLPLGEHLFEVLKTTDKLQKAYDVLSSSLDASPRPDVAAAEGIETQMKAMRETLTIYRATSQKIYELEQKVKALQSKIAENQTSRYGIILVAFMSLKGIPCDSVESEACEKHMPKSVLAETNKSTAVQNPSQLAQDGNS